MNTYLGKQISKKTSNMKSMLLPGDFPPVISGIATYFHEIWKFFPQDKCLILAPKTPGWQDFDQKSALHIIRKKIPVDDTLKAKILKGILYTCWIIRLHLKQRFKVIHCGQVLSSGVTGWILHKLWKVPYIVYVYGSETLRFGHNPLLARGIKLFLKDAQYIIPNSQFTQQEFVNFGIPRHKFKVVTPGVDIDRFKPRPKPAHLIERYKLQSKQVLLTVARLDERKGHDKVLESLAALAPQFPDLVYLIVGKGREEKPLRQMAEEYQLTDRVIFCGFVPDDELPAYYNLCDIFILLNRQTHQHQRLTGDYEGFGIVFLEASACAKPVIAGNFGGIRDAIDDGKSGYIIDGTRTSIVTKYLRKLLVSPEQRQKMGQYGRKWAQQYFNWQTISEKIAPLV